MTLLDQEVKKEEPKGKKIVLLLLILSVVLLIIVIAMMVLLSGNKTNPLTISVNGSNITIENDLLTDENGISYISIQKIGKQLGYDYLTGEYKTYSEDSTNSKGYLQGENQIIQFEADNKTIYKTYPNSNLDYEEYELNNKIINKNNLLYISIDDTNIGLGIVCTYSQKDNKLTLNTVENLTESYKTSLATSTNNQLVEISSDYNNEKALSYGMLVVANQSKKWGVVDTSFNTIIGNRYTNMEFIESVGAFIVSDENKYGVISKEANQRPIIDLNYEEINVINNLPTFYQVKLAGKYGVINGQGKAVINNEYDSMGYTSRSTTEESLLTIENYGANKQNLLVVCKNGKYGLVSLDDGKTVSDCTLDKIYAKNENGQRNYYVGIQNQEVALDRYIEFINTSTVVTN